ncbi:hypothetical protein MMC29_002309 [Sticta canariensis]|nr:hypothetical protein [Sticta canariensis]
MAPSAADVVISPLPDARDSSANTSSSLHITIIGAGIAGLSAAIGLRRAGHKVTMFEKSSFGHETGAAINWSLTRADTLEQSLFADLDHIESTFSAPWFLAHRVDLHNELKLLATQEEGPGEPAKIRLSAEVTGIDPGQGTVTLNNGSSHTSDLVIGADGVHSLAANLVPGHSTSATATAFSAIRFLIPSGEILTDEETRPLIDGKDGQLSLFLDEEGRRLVCYPCRKIWPWFIQTTNTQLKKDGVYQQKYPIFWMNANCFTPDYWLYVGMFVINYTFDRSSISAPRRQAEVSRSNRKAHEPKRWKLLSREPIPKWYQQRLVLIGDAAHPMLPRTYFLFIGRLSSDVEKVFSDHAQGGAQSIEDGAALGILFSRLPPSTTADDLDRTIMERLQGFESVRKDRASAIQIFSNAGPDEPEKIRDEAMKYLKDGVQVPGKTSKTRRRHR